LANICQKQDPGKSADGITQPSTHVDRPGWKGGVEDRSMPLHSSPGGAVIGEHQES